jgi:hypothetical protein
MTKFLLCVHVLAAIIAIGPVAVAASMFPAVARRAPDSGALPVLYRICRVYALVGIAVPVFGFATAGTLHVMGDAWVIASIALTAVAAGVLVLLMLPGQRRILASAPDPARRLAMYAGLFSLLWALVTVLMIVRPGSTTGA